MPPPLRWLAAMLAIAGCSAEVAPIDVGAGCPEQPLRGAALFADEPQRDLIDDFEHEDSSLPHVDGRDGAWILGSDNTSSHLEASTSVQCADRGERAAHLVGRGFTNWGANWTAVVRAQPSGMAVPYDATAYGGISFFAAVSSSAPVPFSLPVGVTTMDVAWNGGICSKCMDYYGTSVALDHSWKRFEVRFDQLAQSGSGEPLVALRPDKFVGVILWPTHDFDVWLDDLRFEP